MILFQLNNLVNSFRKASDKSELARRLSNEQLKLSKDDITNYAKTASKTDDALKGLTDEQTFNKVAEDVGLMMEQNVDRTVKGSNFFKRLSSKNRTFEGTVESVDAIKNILDEAKKLGAQGIVTTEKDAVKIKALLDKNAQDEIGFYALKLGLDIDVEKIRQSDPKKYKDMSDDEILEGLYKFESIMPEKNIDDAMHQEAYDNADSDGNKSAGSNQGTGGYQSPGGYGGTGGVCGIKGCCGKVRFQLRNRGKCVFRL